MSNKILFITARTKGQLKDNSKGTIVKERLLTINVPKKIFKRAVDRNKAKRLIRESFRLIKKDMFTIEGLQIKVSPTVHILNEDFDTITTQIKNEIKKYV
jgi:ribonuclease P protein component